MGRKKIASNYKYQTSSRRAGLRSSKNKLCEKDRNEIDTITKCVDNIVYEGEDMNLKDATNYLNIIINIKKKCIDTYDLQVCEKLEKQLQGILHTIIDNKMDTQKSSISENGAPANDIYDEIMLGTQKLAINDEPVVICNDVNMLEKCQQKFPVTNTDSQETFCSEVETNENQKCSKRVKEYGDTLIHSQDLLTVYEEASNCFITQLNHPGPYSVQRKRKRTNATYIEHNNVTPNDKKNTAYSEQVIYTTRNAELQRSEVCIDITSENEINKSVRINNTVVSKNGDNIFKESLTKTDNTQTLLPTTLIADYQNSNHYSRLSVPNINEKPVVNHNLSDHVEENPVKIIRTNNVINRVVENQIRPCDIDKQILQTDNLSYADVKTPIATNSLAYQCSENQNTATDFFSENEFTSFNVKKDSASEQYSEPYSNISYNPVNTKSTSIPYQYQLNPSMAGINKENISNAEIIPKQKQNTTILADDKEGFKFDTNKSLLANIKEARKTVIDHMKEIRDTYRSSKNSFCTVNHDFGKGNEIHGHTSLFHKPERSSTEVEISTQIQIKQNNPKLDPYSDLQQYLNSSVLQNGWRDNVTLPNVATDLSMKDLIYNWNKLDLQK
ncbi:hypothetical protein CBL_00447 [Carabus blaptoides fortunei]